MYLSPIQQGIQSAHSQMELFVKYDKKSKKGSALFDWATNHKTMIVLNGGFLYDMEAALNFFDQPNNPYPYSEFYESKEALGGILTNIAIVLPEKSYKLSEFLRNKMVGTDLTINDSLPAETYSKIKQTLDDFGKYSPFEIDLAVYMNQFRLA